MKQVLQKLDDLNSHDLTFENFGAILHKIDFAKVEYKEFIPEVINSSNYSRNVLSAKGGSTSGGKEDSLECVIIHWPSGVESAVHLHSEFWCYFAVLEGTCENTKYTLKDGILKENETMNSTVGQIMSVADGHIHKIINPDENSPLITTHFYYPLRNTMDGVAIYDIANERLGILNESALATSWKEPKEHFKSITENAFKYVPHH